MFSTPFLIIGSMMYSIFQGIDPLANTFYLAILLAGVLMIVIGIALIPSSRRARRKIKSVYEIAAVRKQVTITEICEETGHDYEFVQKVITDGILYKRLYGYLEGDLFVRDTSKKPTSSQETDPNLSLKQMSLFDND
jgi:hypothetical protein